MMIGYEPPAGTVTNPQDQQDGGMGGNTGQLSVWLSAFLFDLVMECYTDDMPDGV